METADRNREGEEKEKIAAVEGRPSQTDKKETDKT